MYDTKHTLCFQYALETAAAYSVGTGQQFGVVLHAVIRTQTCTTSQEAVVEVFIVYRHRLHQRGRHAVHIWKMKHGQYLLTTSATATQHGQVSGVKRSR